MSFLFPSHSVVYFCFCFIFDLERSFLIYKKFDFGFCFTSIGVIRKKRAYLQIYLSMIAVLYLRHYCDKAVIAPKALVVEVSEVVVEKAAVAVIWKQ